MKKNRNSESASLPIRCYGSCITITFPAPSRERLAAARPGDQLTVGPYTVRFVGVAPAAGPNWTAVEALLRASQGSGAVELRPQARVFNSPKTETSEVALATSWNGQLYAVIGQQRGDAWQLRLWWKPFVTLIWYGGLMIALGGLMALLARLWLPLRNKWRDMQ